MDNSSKEEVDKEKDSSIFIDKLVFFCNEFAHVFHILNNRLICHFLIYGGDVSQHFYILKYLQWLLFFSEAYLVLEPNRKREILDLLVASLFSLWCKEILLIEMY